jgi:hypothetical protein
VPYVPFHELARPFCLRTVAAPATHLRRWLTVVYSGRTLNDRAAPLRVDPSVAETATSGSSGCEAEVASRYRYCAYGLVIVSDTPLALPEYSHGGLGEVECHSAPASVFRTATRGEDFRPRPDSWYRYAVLHDGSTYVSWDTVGEFLVAADGRRITCRRIDASSVESFQVYMLGQALSFALVRQRFEPLHATAVVVDGQAVAFLGDNAFGKSSLAACFVAAGHPLLTDDLLIVRESSHRLLAYPGPPRIKLFPKIARRFFGHTANSVRMNGDTEKLIVPLDEHRRCDSPVALKAIYSLAAPRDACRTRDVSVETLSSRDAFVALLKGTFNRRLVTSQRLERQFGFIASLSDLISVKKLTYPRTIERLPELRRAVLADLGRG